jgi:hypothetical protein
MASRVKVRRDVWTFLVLLLLFSGVFYALVFSVGPLHASLHVVSGNCGDDHEGRA